MVQGRDGLPRRSPVHLALPMPKRCRHIRTTGKGQTDAPCPIEMAATDSIPPGLEFGGGEEVEKKLTLKHHRIDIDIIDTPCLSWNYSDVVFVMQRSFHLVVNKVGQRHSTHVFLSTNIYLYSICVALKTCLFCIQKSSEQLVQPQWPKLNTIHPY